MFFFTKWVAVRATAAKLWEIEDTSKTISFIRVTASGDLKSEGKRGVNIQYKNTISYTCWYVSLYISYIVPIDFLLISYRFLIDFLRATATKLWEIEDTQHTMLLYQRPGLS